VDSARSVSLHWVVGDQKFVFTETFVLGFGGAHEVMRLYYCSWIPMLFGSVNILLQGWSNMRGKYDSQLVIYSSHFCYIILEGFEPTVNFDDVVVFFLWTKWVHLLNDILDCTFCSSRFIVKVLREFSFVSTSFLVPFYQVFLDFCPGLLRDRIPVPVVHHVSAYAVLDNCWGDCQPDCIACFCYYCFWMHGGTVVKENIDSGGCFNLRNIVRPSIVLSCFFPNSRCLVMLSEMPSYFT